MHCHIHSIGRTLIWWTRITQRFFLVYTIFHTSVQSLQYEEVSENWPPHVLKCYGHNVYAWYFGPAFMYVPFSWFSLVGYLTIFSVSRLHSVRWLADSWTGKDLEGCGHGLNEVLSCICHEGLKNVLKNLLEAGNLAKIQTKHLPDTSLEI
jgi:hypothetical protein